MKTVHTGGSRDPLVRDDTAFRQPWRNRRSLFIWVTGNRDLEEQTDIGVATAVAEAEAS